MTGPLCPISIYGSPVTLLKFQMAPRLILLMSSGSMKEELDTHVWAKPKLHIHKECGPRFHPSAPHPYKMDCLTGPLDEEHFREERSLSSSGNQSYFLGCLPYSLASVPCYLCIQTHKRVLPTCKESMTSNTNDNTPNLHKCMICACNMNQPDSLFSINLFQ